MKNKSNIKVANANIHIGDDFMAEYSSCQSSEGCLKDKDSYMIENSPLVPSIIKELED